MAPVNNHKIKNLLKSPKDKIPPTQKPGIYKIACKECNIAYIGKTKRNLNIRQGEHVAQFIVCLNCYDYDSLILLYMFMKWAICVSRKDVEYFHHLPSHCIELRCLCRLGLIWAQQLGVGHFHGEAWQPWHVAWTWKLQVIM